MAAIRERQIRTTAALKRFEYGPRPTTLAQVADAGYATLPIAQSDVTNLVSDLAAKAPLASPIFTGNPTAPTPATADNDTSIATTAFVKAQGYLAGNQTITLSGDISGSGTTAITTTLTANSVDTSNIANANVTYAKIQNVAASQVLGNPTGSAAAPSEISLGTGLSFAGTVLNGAVGTLTGVTAGTGLTGGGTSGNPTISLTTPVSVANGGTGLSAGVSGGIPYYSSTSAIASSTLLTANALVKGGGAGAAPMASTATVDGSGNLAVAGSITANAELNSNGSLANITFDDRTLGAAGEWNLFAQAGVARLYRGTDKLTLDTSGNLTVTGLVGTATNNNAAAGNVGEYVSSNITTPVGLTSGAVANLTMISVTAGDWDVTGAIKFNSVGVLSDIYACVSMTSADASQSNFATSSWSHSQVTYTTAAVPTQIPAPLRVSVASTTTVYLVVYAQFTSTCTAIGILRARRMR